MQQQMNQQQAVLLQAAAPSSSGLSQLYPSKSSEFNFFHLAKTTLHKRHVTGVAKLKIPTWNFNRNMFTFQTKTSTAEVGFHARFGYRVESREGVLLHRGGATAV